MSTAVTDWNVIREDYLSSELSYKDLSEKYGVKYGHLAKVAASEGWYAARISGNTEQLSREDRILKISDRLLDKIEKSISELDRCIVKNKEKTKTVEYDYDTKKPINEIVEEKEDIKVIDGMIDKMGLKQLVSTLKDIKDIHLSMTGDNPSDEDAGVIYLSDVTEGSDYLENEE